MEQNNLSGQENVQTWACPRCGEKNNLASERYCKKCGFDAMSASQNYQEKKGLGKKIIWGVAILVFLAVLAGGGYYWYVSKQNKIAKDYLISQSENFKGLVNSINELSTEADLQDKDNNLKLFQKKVEDEKIRSEKALADAEKGKSSNEKAVSNKLVSGIDLLFKDFYKDIYDKVKNYDLYIGYEASFVKNVNLTVDEMGKLDTIFKNTKSDEDLLNAMNSEKKIIEDAIVNHKKLVPPPGLEEVQQKEVAYYEKLLALINNLISNFKAKDVQGVISVAKDIDDFYADKKVFEEIDQLQTYYFEKIHDGFIKSREKADNIKTELAKGMSDLKAEVKDINIAGW